MGLWHEINKAGKKADNWLDDHFWDPVNKFGKKVFGNNDFYVGYNSNTDSGIEIKYSPQPETRGIPQGKPQAYSRSTAATAKDIAQGGMTKDEIEEYNIKHPNETALRRK